VQQTTVSVTLMQVSQRIGYGRVSTRDQNAHDQEDALAKAGCDPIFVEQISGTLVERPQWDLVRQALQVGDTLVITRLDRLGRSSKDLQEIAAYLQDTGVYLESTEQPIDTRSREGEIFFSILAAFAEFEHDLIVARTRDGLAAARARGRSGGRRPKLTAQKIADIRKKYEDGDTVQSIASYFGVSRPTIYRALATR
jgi:DNA invertase Pin-like site-specific DNA recombinase